MTISPQSSASSSSKSATAKGARRQDTIIAAAHEILLRDGYAKFTLRDVAAQSGMALGNLQYYYPSRDKLVAAVVEEEISTSFSIISEANWRSGSVEKTLKTLTKVLMQRFGGQEGKLYLLMAFLALHVQPFRNLVNETYNLIFPMVESAVSQISPSMKQKEIADTAEVIVAIFDGAAARIHAQPDLFDEKRLAQYSDIIASAILKIVTR